jgi:DNA polymerase
MPDVVVDSESRSVVKLRECGSYAYSIDPSTQILCLVYAIDDGEFQLWLVGDPQPTVFFEISADPKNWKLISHNNDFDRPMYENQLVLRHDFQSIPLEAWHCTQRLALANAYPAELDLLAQALGLSYRKDPAARKAMLAVSRPKANRKRKATTIPIWDEDPAKLQLLHERCRRDGITARAVWLSPKLKHLSETERRFQLQDLTINVRGVQLDRAFATAARDLAIHERIAINLKLQELTHGTITSVDQPKRFLEAINARGHNMTTMNKRAVAQTLAGKPDDYVRQLLELRRTGARAAVNKFKRMLVYAAPTDDRMRGTLRMYGSATGRWTGLGPQLQNLKKNESNLPLSVVDSIRAGDRNDIARYGNPLGLLGDVSRAALCAGPGLELKSGDFSAVESVMLAWLAGEHWKLVAYQTYQKTSDTTLEPSASSPGACCTSRRMPRSAPPNASLARQRIWLRGSGDRLAPGDASSPTIHAATRKSEPSSANGARHIPPFANSGMSSHGPSGSQSAPDKRFWSRHLRNRPS